MAGSMWVRRMLVCYRSRVRTLSPLRAQAVDRCQLCSVTIQTISLSATMVRVWPSSTPRRVRWSTTPSLALRSTCLSVRFTPSLRTVREISGLVCCRRVSTVSPSSRVASAIWVLVWVVVMSSATPVSSVCSSMRRAARGLVPIRMASITLTSMNGWCATLPRASLRR